ncbi:MAG: ATP-binding protein [Polyangia bacterium]
MDQSRVQSSLLGWIIALAITVSVLLRRDKDLRQKLFILLGGNVTLFYFFTFLYTWRGEPWFERISLTMAVLIPQSGLHFFRALAASSHQRIRFGRLALVLGIALIAVVLHPSLLRPAVGPAVLAYVVGFTLVAILDLNVQARSAPTRFDAARIRYLFYGGLATLTLQVAERLAHAFHLDLPPVGLAMTLLYLYFISQTIVRYRVLDLYEMLGRLAVLTLMGAALAGIYTALVLWAGRGFAINAFLASLVILLLFDPLRDLVERKISDFFFGERREMENRLVDLRRRLGHLIGIDAMIEVLVTGLEETRRFTHAALYLIDPNSRGYDLRSGFGPEPSLQRVEAVAVRRQLLPFTAGGAISAARLAEERQRLLQSDQSDRLLLAGEAQELLEGMNADVLLPVEGEEQILGLLVVRDERLRDAFSPEEVTMLAGLAGQVAITVENSQLYQQMKERDRLAVLGQMSAGLAHEIRNPLGSIKAAAQFIEEVAPGRKSSDEDQERDSGDREFLAVIVEEVDRLNRVVSDFLSYARPSSGDPRRQDVNEVLRRTLQVFETGRAKRVDLVVELAEDLAPVMVYGEHLHQVFLNLLINGAQATEESEQPRLSVSTKMHSIRRGRDTGGERDRSRFVEVRFADNGPGIPPEILQNIFIPFFTTKSKGSGLGLSVCQRIVRDAGGEIEVRSQMGQGSIFTVVLPATEEQKESSQDEFESNSWTAERTGK